MADDMTDKIKSILNNPEMMNMFNSLITPENESSRNDSSLSDIAQSLKTAMNGINGTHDKRINLLNALKPYMRQSRSSNIDKAIRMIKLTQLGSILKDL